MRLISVAVFIASFMSAAFAEPPPALFELPNVVAVQPVPPPPMASDTTPLIDGQWYVVTSSQNLILKQVSLGGEVTISPSKKNSLTLPSSWVVGRKPDVDDPDFTTITAKYLYIIKAKFTETPGGKIVSIGKTTVLIYPTTNKTTDKGVPIPFTEKDFGQVTFDVQAKTPPIVPPVVPPVTPPVVPPVTPPVVPPIVVPPVTPPVTPPVVPPVALTPFQTKLKAAIGEDGCPPADVAKYAALFRNAATIMVNDQTLKTGGDLLKEMQTAVKGLGIPAGSMNKTARCVADELDQFISKPGALDATSRANIATLFTRIAGDLILTGGNR